MLQATEFPDSQAFPQSLRVALALPGRQSDLADVRMTTSTVFSECDDAGIVPDSIHPLAWRLGGCCLTIFPLALENRSSSTFAHQVELISALRPLPKCITFSHIDQALIVDIITETNVLSTIELPYSLFSQALPPKVRCAARYLTATNSVPPMVLQTLPPHANNGPGCELAVGCQDGSLLSLSRDEPLGQLSFLKLDGMDANQAGGWTSWLRRPHVPHLARDPSLALSAPLSLAANANYIVSVSVNGAVTLWSRSREAAIGQTAAVPAKNEHTGAHVVLSADGSHAAVYFVLDDENSHAQFSIYKLGSSSLVLKKTVAAPRQGFTSGLRSLAGFSLVMGDAPEIWASWSRQTWVLTDAAALCVDVGALAAEFVGDKMWAISQSGLAVVEQRPELAELADARALCARIDPRSQAQLEQFVVNGGSEDELAVIVQDARLSTGTPAPPPNVDGVLAALASAPSRATLCAPTALGAIYMAHSAKLSAETAAETLRVVLACTSETNYRQALCLAADAAMVRACVHAADYSVLVAVASRVLLDGTRFAWQDLSLLNGQPAAVRPVMQLAAQGVVPAVQSCNIANALMFGHNKTLVVVAAYVLVCSRDYDAQAKGVGLLLEYCGQAGQASCGMAELALIASQPRETAVCEAARLCAALDVDPQLQLSLASAGTSVEAHRLACRAALAAGELERAWAAVQQTRDRDLMAMLLAALRQTRAGRELFARLDFAACYDVAASVLRAGAEADQGFARMLYLLAVARGDFELAASAAELAAGAAELADAKNGAASKAIAANARRLSIN